MGTGGGNVPLIKSIECQSGLIQPTDRKYKEHNVARSEHIEFKNDNCSHALRASVIPVTVSHHNSQNLFDEYRIRKLTPRECFKLMGFTDAEFDKAQSAGISNSQLYKQAGNSIVVNVLEKILKNLIDV